MSLWSPPALAAPAPAAPPSDGPAYVRLSGPALVAVAAAAGLALLTANPLLTAASLLVLPVFAVLLWRQGETPVLLFAVGFQWVQVTAKVFHADTLGVDVAELAATPSVKTAVWLSLAGLVALALGMRLGMRALRTSTSERARAEAAWFSVDRAFTFYLVCFVISEGMRALGGSSAGLAQIAQGVSGVKWVAFFLFGYTALRQRRRLPLVLLVVGFEFIMGIGFFAGFKEVLFISLIMYFTARPSLKPAALISGTVILAFLVLFGATWQSVKGEYRYFLSGGSGDQGTVVSQSEGLLFLRDLVTELTPADLVARGFEPMFERLAYVDYFAIVTDYVPTVIPHEGGALWGGAVRHVLQPRVLFPDKPVLPSDTELTEKYTGLHVADTGTSVSLGYMGESYVDFGAVGMLVPVFLLGAVWGLIYAYFVGKARYALVGYAFATALLVQAYQFEIASIKLLGGILAKFIVLALLLRFAESRIESWLLADDAPVDDLEPEPAAVAA